jgi:hypothetical protein
MEYSRGARVWKQAVSTLRCPYCVEGNEFRPMVGLSGSPDGLFFCSVCRHLANSSEPGFKCVCANCRNLNRDLRSGGLQSGEIG